MFSPIQKMEIIDVEIGDQLRSTSEHNMMCPKGQILTVTRIETKEFMGNESQTVIVIDADGEEHRIPPPTNLLYEKVEADDPLETDRIHILTTEQNEFIELETRDGLLYASYNPTIGDWKHQKPTQLGIVGVVENPDTLTETEQQAAVNATLDTIKERMAAHFPDVRFTFA